MRFSGSVKCLKCSKQSPFMVKTHDAPTVEIITNCLRCRHRHIITVSVKNYKEDVDAIRTDQNISPEVPGRDSADSKQPLAGVPTSNNAKGEKEDLEKMFDDIIEEADKQTG